MNDGIEIPDSMMEEAEREGEEFMVNVNCGNCGEARTLKIKNGTSVKDYLRLSTEKCYNCKCRIDSNTYSVQHKHL